MEHVIIDNMSNDSTEGIVQAYAESAPYPVTYVREPDDGIYDALNKGIRKASGQWLLFLHADDYLELDSLARVFAGNNESFDLLVCGVRQYNETGACVHEWIPRYDERHPQPHYYPHTGTIFRKRFFDVHGLYSTRYKIVSDTVYNYRFYDNHARIRLYDDVILTHMLHSGISVKPSKMLYAEMLILAVFYMNLSMGKKYKEAKKYLKLYLRAKR